MYNFDPVITHLVLTFLVPGPQSPVRKLRLVTGDQGPGTGDACYLWYFRKMRRFAAAAALIVSFAGCPQQPDEELDGWHQVLARKKAVSRASATDLIEAKQNYVDALRDFCRNFPNHARARVAYREAELQFARELYSDGRYADAARFFESVLRDDPRDASVKRELVATIEKKFVSREGLAELRKGMRPQEVAERIGRPLPGWEQSVQKGPATILGWYYPRGDGGIGGVYFLDGHLFAAEYDRAVRLKP